MGRGKQKQKEAEETNGLHIHLQLSVRKLTPEGSMLNETEFKASGVTSSDAQSNFAFLISQYKGGLQ